MQKLYDLIKRHESVVLYAVFGLMTTVVNYFVYFPLLYFANFTAVLSNIIAWLLAVLFSFFTNKPFVFKSNDWSFKILLHELFWFIGCRLFTGILETTALFVFVDVMEMNGFICKLVVSVGVVILNYISSKIFVFQKKKNAP